MPGGTVSRCSRQCPENLGTVDNSSGYTTRKISVGQSDSLSIILIHMYIRTRMLAYIHIYMYTCDLCRLINSVVVYQWHPGRIEDYVLSKCETRSVGQTPTCVKKSTLVLFFLQGSEHHQSDVRER